ncbi:MAG: hypothetical protein ACLU7D_07120 [Collinsella sp.]
MSRITAGIGQVLGRRGYQMLLANTDNAPERELEYLDLFQNHPVDGIVLVATMITDEPIDAAITCLPCAHCANRPKRRGRGLRLP